MRKPRNPRRQAGPAGGGGISTPQGLAMQTANQLPAYAYAAASGQPYYWQQQGALFGGVAGAMIGFGEGGIPGAAIGAAVGGIGGGIGSAIWQGHRDAALQQLLTSMLTGQSTTQVAAMAQGMAGIIDPVSGYQMNTMAATMAMGAMSPVLAGGGNMGTLQNVSAFMEQNWGLPTSPAFQAASASVIPALSNPLLQNAFAHAMAPGQMGSFGAGTPADVYNLMGNVGGYYALEAAKASPVTMLQFGLYAGQSTFGNLALQGGASAAGGAQAEIGSALLTGDRSAMEGAYQSAEGTLGRFGGIIDNQLKMQESFSRAGSPTAAVKVLALQQQRAANNFAQNQAQFEMGTMGAGGNWTAQMIGLQTSEASAMMDPFMPFVSPELRRQVISQTQSRIADINAQDQNAPAALRPGITAANAPELSRLTLQQTQEENALRYGVMTRAFSVFAGAPGGYQALGLQGESVASLQAYGRRTGTGIPEAFGGGGVTTGSPDSKTVVNLLQRIALALEGHRSGDPGGNAGNIYTYQNRRVNGNIGPGN